MTLTLVAEPLPLRLDEGGTYRVGPTRVRLDSVVFLYNHGSSAEQIIAEYPSLQLADVHAVIAYYLRHKGEVDAYLHERQLQAQALRQEMEAAGFVMSAEKTAEIKRRFLERQARKD